MIEIYNEFEDQIKKRIADEKGRIAIRTLDLALQKFGDEHPEIIASFRGPYPTASEHDIHIITHSHIEPNDDAINLFYGFDTGSGRFFSMKILTKDIPAFLQAAAESRESKHSPDGRYHQISDSYPFKDTDSGTFFFFELGYETNYHIEDNPVYEAAKPVFAAMGAKLDELKPRGLPNFFGEKATS